MTGGLYFIAVSARNRARVQLRRLRSPRYFIAALVGLLYFVLIFGDWTRGGSPDDVALGAEYIVAARRLGPLVIGLMAAWWWLWGGHRRGLVLTPAETHLLVPAPLSRAALVRFKILQAQTPILFSAALAALLTRGSDLPWPLRFLSLWTLLATLHQHQIAASLVHAAAEEQGRRGIRRHWLPLLLFGGAFAGVVWSVGRAVAEVRTSGMAAALARAVALMDEPVPRYALAPFRLLLEPLLATSAAAWAPAFAAAVVVLAAHYLWVQRTDAAFEESAAREGQVRETRAAALRAGGAGRAAFEGPGRRRLARPWLPLPPTGRAGYAIYWKNVLYVQRLLRPATIVLVLAGLAMLATPAVLGAGSPAAMLRNTGIALLVLAGIITAAGALAVRNDLRLDLGHTELLRTLPLSGRDVVAAGIAAAATVVVLLQTLFAAGGILLLTAAGTLPPLEGVLAALAAPLLLAPVAALAVIIQNALVLLFPGWIRVGGHEGGGMEAIGQNVLTLTGSLLIMAVASLPPLVVGGAVGAVAAATGSVPLAVAVAAGALAAAATLAAECWLLIIWLGGLYDRTDPAAAGFLR